MGSASQPTAWDSWSTRLEWSKVLAASLAGLVAWGGGWVIMLGISANGPNWLVWVFIPFWVYGFYRMVLQLRGIPVVFSLLWILREYPWQIYYEAARGIDDHPDAEAPGIWIELPDPAGRSDAGIPLVFVKHHRAFWWLRRIGGPRTKPALKARLEPLWFAGDPRFLGVVAVSSRDGKAPRRLHFLYQPSAFDGRAPRRSWEGVEPADLERARRAGARFADVPSTAVSGAKGSEGAES
ncbi:hypothetical protein [Streptomyces sp. NBRC 110035]|uniref:hypothetical protein n=1 Tax=Streptomyces sp. NBRC 110035 TaxID=1547867 RepID=UPI00131E228C|nr:hypothetical protein [Streptomyces sp. NBRC 110035]